MDHRHSSAVHRHHHRHHHQQHLPQHNNTPIPNSVVSFMRKIVSKSQSPSESTSSQASTPLSGHSVSPSGALSSVPLPSTMGQDQSRGPFMHKLRQKLSNSGRVMASAITRAQPSSSSSSSTSSLTAEQLTAHLTEEEREILQKVFLKEEQFRESTNKSGEPISPLESPQSTQTHKQLDRHNSIGQCRICRKHITERENHHQCSNCGQLVCDDCSSYQSRDDTRYWMCSFCRRRGTQPTLMGCEQFGLIQRMSLAAKTNRKNSSADGFTHSPNRGRRPSLGERQRQHSLEVMTSAKNTQIAKSRSRPSSPPEKSPLMASYTSSENLSDRRSSGESAGIMGICFSQPCDSGFKSREELRKVYSASASDSSFEDDDDDRDHKVKGHHRRRRSRKTKIQRQKRSLTGDEKMERDEYIVATDALRHISSDAVICAQNGFHRRKSSSSDVSDVHCSPPPDSYTSGDSPYWRSPRESADSDMLGLPSYAHFGQRRSIPSLQIDTVDNNHLTLRECFPRRSSTGRALPKVPDKEQARSMLDLPHSRKSSSHSLDLPIDQPRRASAPEGENIRIVIDDVDTRGQQQHQQTSPYERVILHRDDRDTSSGTRGFGLRVIGGKVSQDDGSLQAYITHIVVGGSAAKMGLKEGDRIIEWNGRSLINLSYEQVNHTLDNSGSTAELIIEKQCDVIGQHYVHQRRRLSSAQNSFDMNTNVINQNVNTRRRLPKPPSVSTDADIDNLNQHHHTHTLSLERKSMDEISSPIWGKRGSSLKIHSVTDLHAMESIDAGDGGTADLKPPPIAERRKSSSAIANIRLKRSCSLKSERSTATTSNESIGSVDDSHVPRVLSRDGHLGEIKLGIIMTQGMIEVEAIAAKGLPLNANGQPPDTYVKLHLKDKKRGLMNKKKTRVVNGECNPVWRQVIKYDASVLDGRTLMVSVWERRKGIDANTPIGTVDIVVDHLQLHKLTIAWYKLMPLIGQWSEL